MKLRLLPILLVVLGCGTDKAGPPVLPGLTVPPKPDNGVQIITGIFDGIQPSMDYEVCEWTDQFFEQDTDIKAVQAWQPEPPGHHVIVYYTMTHRPAGTQAICKDSDMVTFRFIAGSVMGVRNEAPGNLVFHVPAGAQIVVNHHYLNVTDNVLRGQAIANLEFAPAGGNYVDSGNLAVIDDGIQVQPGDSTWDIHCPVTQPFKIWNIFPHMHRWGKHVKFSVTQNSVTNMMFDLDWDPTFTFHPPEMMFDPNTPMELNPGDSLDVHCEWNNDTGGTLGFGAEMCVGFGFTVDDQKQGGFACNAGDWGPF